MLTMSDIFIELSSSTLVSNLYGFIRNILYVFYVAPYCNFTFPLVKHCVITKGTLYCVSYLYALWLVSITLSPTLYS